MGEITKLLITPVDSDCNMACGYCYNGSFHKSRSEPSKVISMDTLHKIFDQITPYLKGDRLFVIWHGGEPLLAGMEFYREAILVQKKAVSGRYEPINCFQTNATLIDESWIKLIQELEIRPSVSIDGPAFLHNSIRTYANNGPTYYDVMRGYNLLRNNGIETGLLMVVSKKNVQNPDEIWQWVLEEQIIRFDFLPCIEPELWPTGNLIYSVNSDEILDFSRRLFDLWLNFEEPKIRIRTFRDAIKGQIGGNVNLCSWKSGCSQHFSFDSLGNAYLCARYHCYPETILGNINEQQFSDIMGSPTIDRIHQSIMAGQDRCMSCEWYQMCHSGCPFLKYALHGTWSASYVHCQFRQVFFQHVRKRIFY